MFPQIPHCVHLSCEIVHPGARRGWPHKNHPETPPRNRNLTFPCALQGVLDLTCAVNVAGMDLPKRVFGRKLNDGVIGAVGCASALCVLYNSWPARPATSAAAASTRSPADAGAGEVAAAVELAAAGGDAVAAASSAPREGKGAVKTRRGLTVPHG